MGCLKLTYRDELPTLKVVQGFSFSSEESCAGLYRFAFNGMEQDNEVSGNGNSYTAEFWQYDSRLGRRWNIDPVVKHHESPYAAFANNPIWFIDPSGADTTFADNQARKEFNKAHEAVQNTVSGLETKIKTIEGQLSSGDLNKRQTKKANKELEYANRNLKNWNKLQDDFTSIIESPVQYNYSTNESLLKSTENGLTSPSGQGDFLKENKETGKLVGGQITIVVRPGRTGAELIHENRHGVQIANGRDTKNTFEVESEAYRYQQIFNPASVQREINAVQRIKYGHMDPNLRPQVSFDEMIKYLYNLK